VARLGYPNYLGFPGTTALPEMDYLIADRTVIPENERDCYTEKIVYLPDTYLPSDSQRRIGERIFRRAEEGLPETGFVFASFNNSCKFTPEMFAVWMRLLSAVDGSVLWLSKMNDLAQANLRREAAARGITPERLVFARHAPIPEYLARLAAADLFLDTFPYNAGAIANDALWAGLPVLTCAGNSYVGRMAGSLLHAVGLPELVTASPAEYEARALELARDPARLRELRRRLADNRAGMPLFDMARYTSDIEAAYTGMWQRWHAGEPPAPFRVAADVNRFS